MSLRKRLNLSFMAMIILPCILLIIVMLLFFFAFLSGEDLTTSGFDLSHTEKKNSLFSAMKLKTTAEPEVFYDHAYLNKQAEELKQLNTALLVRIDDTIYFRSALLAELPIAEHLTDFGQFINHAHDSVQIGKTSVKLEQHDFYLPGHRQASIFLIKESQLFEQFSRQFFPVFLILFVVIIIITNGTLSYLVSRSILLETR